MLKEHRTGRGRRCPGPGVTRPLFDSQGQGRTPAPAPPRPGHLAPGRSLDSGPLLTSTSLCFAVIRAKAVSEKEVDSGNDIYGNPIKRIQYEIKQIKVTTWPGWRPRVWRVQGGPGSLELSPAACGAESKAQAGLILLIHECLRSRAEMVGSQRPPSCQKHVTLM